MILSKALRTPICIDPQSKAIAYIRETNPCQNNIKYLKLGTDNVIVELKKAITLGEIVVIEDLNEYIDSNLSDLLEKRLIS